jgi:putative transposase
MRAAARVGVDPRQGLPTTRRDDRAGGAAALVQRLVPVPEPNRLWVADSPSPPTWGGLLELAVVLGAYSRRRAGRAIADPLCTAPHESSPCWRRRSGCGPGAGPGAPSQQGCPYTRRAFGQGGPQSGRSVSLEAVGACYDHALTERCLATRQCEQIVRSRWRTLTEARLAVFDDIEKFNKPPRRHFALAYRSPADYERRPHTDSTAV